MYGDEIGVQYAESLMHFAKDSEETKERVDDLLDSLTDGEHRKTVDKIKSRELLREDDDTESSAPANDQSDEVGTPARLNGDHRWVDVSASGVSSKRAEVQMFFSSFFCGGLRDRKRRFLVIVGFINMIIIIYFYYLVVYLFT